jgi:hypothetical protein
MKNHSNSSEHRNLNSDCLFIQHIALTSCQSEYHNSEQFDVNLISLDYMGRARHSLDYFIICFTPYSPVNCTLYT